MTEALPDEEPSVLISVSVLRVLVDIATIPYWENEHPEGQPREDAIEEAESALERYK